MTDERGFTLIELLIASSIMIVILLATLSIFDVFFQTDRSNQSQTDAQAAARIATDRLARELRNAAYPGRSTGFERAAGTDLVFDMVDPTGTASGLNTSNVERVRYCLDTSATTNEKIWREVQTWTTASPPALPGAATCPDFTWNHTPQVVVDKITNDGSHPPFLFNSSSLSGITQVMTDLYVDYSVGRTPGASELRTSVTIRSTTQPPTAVMTATPEGNGQVLLNGGGSGDPSGQSLTYRWYVDGGTTAIGKSAIFSYSSPTGSHTFSLTVTNTAGLSSTASQTVNVT